MLRDGSGPSVAAALLTLANFGGAASIDTLATALGVTHSGAVRVVDRLERSGLARRRRSTGDGRAVDVVLTADGDTAARRRRAGREGVVAAWLAPLDAGEQAALTTLVEKLLAGRTDGRDAALSICRLCDAGVCGHPDRCPVTQAADRARGT